MISAKHSVKTAKNFYCSSKAALMFLLRCFLSFIKADKYAPANKIIADPKTIRLIVIALLILKISTIICIDAKTKSDFIIFLFYYDFRLKNSYSWFIEC